MALIPFVGVAVGKLIDTARSAIKSFVGSKVKEAADLLIGAVKDTAKAVVGGLGKLVNKVGGFIFK